MDTVLTLSDCAPISNCAVTVACTSVTNSQCTTCNSGYYLVDGIADTCVGMNYTTILYPYNISKLASMYPIALVL